MKKILFLLASLPLLCACSNIADDEKLIYVEPELAKRTILLEDFTGQRCVNCPKATDIIEQLQEEYGDNIVAVGIYSGEFGKLPNGNLLPLTTETGCEYFNHYVAGYGQPIGMVNRHEPMNHTDWTTTIRSEISKSSPIEISLTAAIKDNNIEISIHENDISEAITGKLQVWVLEDNITAFQFMPDGSSNKDYIHNHVFRTTVNGTWGEDITLNEGEQKTQTMSQPIANEWNKDNLSIVAFIYNNDGVLQAAKTKVNNKLK